MVEINRRQFLGVNIAAFAARTLATLGELLEQAAGGDRLKVLDAALSTYLKKISMQPGWVLIAEDKRVPLDFAATARYLEKISGYSDALDAETVFRKLRPSKEQLIGSFERIKALPPVLTPADTAKRRAHENRHGYTPRSEEQMVEEARRFSGAQNQLERIRHRLGERAGSGPVTIADAEKYVLDTIQRSLNITPEQLEAEYRQVEKIVNEHKIYAKQVINEQTARVAEVRKPIFPDMASSKKAVKNEQTPWPGQHAAMLRPKEAQISELPTNLLAALRMKAENKSHPSGVVISHRKEAPKAAHYAPLRPRWDPSKDQELQTAMEHYEQKNNPENAENALRRASAWEERLRTQETNLAKGK